MPGLQREQCTILAILLEHMQGHSNGEDDGELVAGVEEEVTERVVVSDVVRRLQARVQQAEPHRKDSGVLPAAHRPVPPGNKERAASLMSCTVRGEYATRTVEVLTTILVHALHTPV